MTPQENNNPDDSECHEQRFFAWNPTVYDGFGDTLVFFLIEAQTFRKEHLMKKVRALLEEMRFTSYRIYHIFGDADLIVRAWVTKGREQQLAGKIQSQLDEVSSVEPYLVWDIPHHWKWGPIKLQSSSLSKLTPDFVNAVQSAFQDFEQWPPEIVDEAMEKGLLREITTNPENISFYAFIKSHESWMMRGASLQNLVQHLVNLMRECEPIEFTAVYFLQGDQTKFLIKAEANNFYDIGTFIVQLNEMLALGGCVTMTSIVASKPILGSEKIGQRSFDHAKKRDVAISQILPELYESTLSDSKRAEIETWTKQHIVERDWKKNGPMLKRLRVALKCVIDQDEDGFVEALFGIFRSPERKLRGLQGKFIVKHMGDGQVQTTLIDALKHTPNPQNKMLSHLTLGDRLDVYLYVIKLKNLSDDTIIVESWDTSVELRNSLVHNSRDMLPEWQKHLSITADFANRVAVLLRVIQDKK